jgi:hypothetical protein
MYFHDSAFLIFHICLLQSWGSRPSSTSFNEKGYLPCHNHCVEVPIVVGCAVKVLSYEHPIHGLLISMDFSSLTFAKILFIFSDYLLLADCQMSKGIIAISPFSRMYLIWCFTSIKKYFSKCDSQVISHYKRGITFSEWFFQSFLTSL